MACAPKTIAEVTVPKSVKSVHFITLADKDTEKCTAGVIFLGLGKSITVALLLYSGEIHFPTMFI